MDNTIRIKCPTCGKILRLNNVPNINAATFTCPVCKEKHVVGQCQLFDVSNENIQMQDFQDAHVAQQQDMMQQEQEHLAYNASDDQPDYYNNADIQDA